MKKDIGSLRSTLEYLEAVGELVSTDVEVDAHLEVAAIQKHFDGGAALLFNRVKGYPNARICTTSSPAPNASPSSSTSRTHAGLSTGRWRLCAIRFPRWRCRTVPARKSC
jgi:hypothetical protein